MLTKKLARKYYLGKVLTLNKEKIEDLEIKDEQGKTSIRKGYFLEKDLPLILEELTEATEYAITGYDELYNYITASPVTEESIFYTEITALYQRAIDEWNIGEKSEQIQKAIQAQKKLAEKQPLLYSRKEKEVQEFDETERKFFQVLNKKEKRTQAQSLLKELQWRTVLDTEREYQWIRESLEKEEDKTEWASFYKRNLEGRFEKAYLASEQKFFGIITFVERKEEHPIQGLELEFMNTNNKVIQEYNKLNDSEIRALMLVSLEDLLKKKQPKHILISSANINEQEKNTLQECGYKPKRVIMKNGVHTYLVKSLS